MGEWILVPREPTEAMILAAQEHNVDCGADMGDAYRAMIAAAPSPDPVGVPGKLGEISRIFRDGWAQEDSGNYYDMLRDIKEILDGPVARNSGQPTTTAGA